MPDEPLPDGPPPASAEPHGHAHPGEHDHGDHKDHDHSHGEPYPRLSEMSELAEAGMAGAVCPRCGSWEVVAGNLLDGLGQNIRFALMYRQRAPGVPNDEAPPVIALYCNACGEVTLTLG